MNNLIKPCLYQAYHQILPVITTSNKKTEKVDLVTPGCETSDFIARDRKFPPLKKNDFLAIIAAGAYGQSQSSYCRKTYRRMQLKSCKR